MNKFYIKRNTEHHFWGGNPEGNIFGQWVKTEVEATLFDTWDEAESVAELLRPTNGEVFILPLEAEDDHDDAWDRAFKGI